MKDNVRELPLRQPWDPDLHLAAPGTRFVGPHDFVDSARGIVRGSLVKSIVVEALADAAGAEDVLLDFSVPEFFRTHVAKALNHDLSDDEQAAPLVYDQFTAMALMDCVNSLMLEDGLLGHRGNGDSADYRLALPDRRQPANACCRYAPGSESGERTALPRLLPGIARLVRINKFVDGNDDAGADDASHVGVARPRCRALP